MPVKLIGAGLLAFALLSLPAHAEIDGHGPDSWRVTGVAAKDVLNARMGPGSNYPVIESFAYNEKNLQQITCVPFYTAAHYTEMSEAQLKALPARWCLMRDAEMRKAGWVAQRYLTSSDTVEVPEVKSGKPVKAAADDGDDIIVDAELLVHDLYKKYELSQKGAGPDPLRPPLASKYFTADIVKLLASGGLDAHPLYGAQDFDGTIQQPVRDADQPMLRGMITINVDFTNFGHPQRAIYYLRADTSKSGAPFRILMVEHEGWSYP